MVDFVKLQNENLPVVNMASSSDVGLYSPNSAVPANPKKKSGKDDDNDRLATVYIRVICYLLGYKVST